jgi:hypothetical protein
MLGWRARIGVLVAPGNPTVEPELYRMALPGVSIRFARFDPSDDTGEPGAWAHTGASYVNTLAGEDALVERLTPAARVPAATAARVPATTAARAIATALRHLGARTLALGTPYRETIGALGRAYGNASSAISASRWSAASPPRSGTGGAWPGPAGPSPASAACSAKRAGRPAGPPGAHLTARALR